jgi:lactate permease
MNFLGDLSIYVFAALPILIVLFLMVGRRWGGQRAGPLGWWLALIVACVFFGLTWDVWWVSQLKGLLLSLYVLAVLWPALFLYNVANQTGGIRAIAGALERLMVDRGLLLIVVAWAFSGMLEGLAGFGVPVAIVAPMLVGMGVSPVTAVAAVAVGHAWAVTFGDMGVIFQTLIAVTNLDGALLAPFAALMVGAACWACGIATAFILGQGKRWLPVSLLAVLMALTQYALAVSSLSPLAALAAGAVGLIGGIVLSLRQGTNQTAAPITDRPALIGALSSYGALTLLMGAIALIGPLHDALYGVVWKAAFPQVSTLAGFVTKAGSGQVFRPLVHPGSAVFLVACLSYFAYRRAGLTAPGSWRTAAGATWRAAAPLSIGVIAMVCLSTVMEHCGMTVLLAQGISGVVGAAFPIVSPAIGMLGAFATGSNNNSNVLFAPLQQSAALLLSITPGVLLGAQTAGGSVGSMIAPAKIIVGCSTTGIKGRDGDVLRLTLPYGLIIGLGLGLLALVLARLS